MFYLCDHAFPRSFDGAGVWRCRRLLLTSEKYEQQQIFESIARRSSNFDGSKCAWHWRISFFFHRDSTLENGYLIPGPDRKSRPGCLADWLAGWLESIDRCVFLEHARLKSDFSFYLFFKSIIDTKLIKVTWRHWSATPSHVNSASWSIRQQEKCLPK